MASQTYKWLGFFLSLAGVLFSGYLSGVKFFSNTCAFNQACPYFVGYPACYFGFLMFVMLFLSLSLFAAGRAGFKKTAKFNSLVSGIGVLFSGYFSYPEVRSMAEGTFDTYFFGLSTCIYGFFFFVIIFLISLLALRAKS